jgi:protein phosphatase
MPKDIQTAGLTDIGKVRSQNQDSIFFSAQPVGSLPNLFIVADGMGGHNAGDVASQQAISLFTAYIKKSAAEPDDFLDVCIAAASYANHGIFMQASENPSLHGMGTTFSACFIYNGICRIVHVGDSRVYMASPGGLTQLTHDHSFVNEMVRAGQITARQARQHPRRNVLTRVMGVDSRMEADGYTRSLDGACAILLCSDGLFGMLADDRILGFIRSDASAEERAAALIDAANDAGGTDNISVILIDVSR